MAQEYSGRGMHDSADCQVGTSQRGFLRSDRWLPAKQDIEVARAAQIPVLIFLSTIFLSSTIRKMQRRTRERNMGGTLAEGFAVRSMLPMNFVIIFVSLILPSSICRGSRRLTVNVK
jgi:hypothetical protein